MKPNKGSVLAALLTVLVCSLTLAAPPGSGAQGGRATTIWDVRDLGQLGQMAIYNSDLDGTTLGMPCAAGDLNGDGYDDAILAPFLAASGPTNTRVRAGDLHVYFGRPGELAGTLHAGDPPPDAVQIFGAHGGDFLGNEVDAADVTGDGFADILACAQNADGFGAETNRTNAGALYVIRGGETWEGPIDLATPPARVTQILGAQPGDRCGFWPAAGDVDGDGIKDILVSADLADGVGDVGSGRGELYIIPGGPDLPARIDLADADQKAELGIVTIFGVDDCDHFGSCIAAADFDRDGFDDIVCSAGVARSGAVPNGKQAVCSNGTGGGDGPNNDRSSAGEVYVIYGRAEWPATIALAAPTPDVAVYYGQNAGDHFGEDVRVGDFDGDLVPELAVGALTASAPDATSPSQIRQRSGIGYVYWGAELERGERLDLRDLTSFQTRVTRIYGEGAGDIGADTIALADLDRDGLAEMIFASPLFDPPGRAEAGDLKVIFGRQNRLPSVVDLANLPAGVQAFRVIAADPNDMFAYSYTSGDFNGDGYTDMMPNGMGGDGLGNCCRDAGELYIISGQEFSLRAGRTPPGATCLSRVDVTPASTVYYAGQSGVELTLVCDSGSPELAFAEGAVAILNGVEVATTFVSPTRLVVRLDGAPELRNTPGPVFVRVRNVGSEPSAAIEALELLGPEITSLKAKRKGSNIRLTVRGTDFLVGADVVVTDQAGAPITVAKVKRKSATKIKVTIDRALVPAGAQLVVRVANPGPALSEAASVAAP